MESLVRLSEGFTRLGEPLCLGEGGLHLGEPGTNAVACYCLFGAGLVAWFVIIMAFFEAIV